MSKLIIYAVGRYDVFRGKTDPNTWYVYDREDKRYVGGSFSTLKDAKVYAEELS